MSGADVFKLLKQALFDLEVFVLLSFRLYYLFELACKGNGEKTFEKHGTLKNLVRDDSQFYFSSLNRTH